MFLARARTARLSSEDFRLIEVEIINDPQGWLVMAGTGGLRKMRYSPHSTSGGKRGGSRICYFIIDSLGHVYLVTAFAKNEKANLDPGEIKEIRKLIANIKSREKK